ncbi:hypothetical protein D3C76_1247140 [compost metagenome]
MQHTGLTQVRFAQQVQGVGTRRTGVNDHRLAGSLRSLQVQAEGLLLHLGRFWLVVIIQPGFTDGHHMRVLKLLEQPLQRRRTVGSQVQRMDAYRAVNVAVTLTQVFDRLGVVGTDADAQEMADTTGAGSLKGRIQRTLVSGEVETIEMAMGIYKHGQMTTLKRNKGAARLNAGRATWPRRPAALRATARD